MALFAKVNPETTPLSLRPVPWMWLMVLPVMVVGVAMLLRIPVDPLEIVLPVIAAPVEPAEISMPGPLLGLTVLASTIVSLA